LSQSFHTLIDFFSTLKVAFLMTLASLGSVVFEERRQSNGMMHSTLSLPLGIDSGGHKVEDTLPSIASLQRSQLTQPIIALWRSDLIGSTSDSNLIQAGNTRALTGGPFEQVRVTYTT